MKGGYSRKSVLTGITSFLIVLFTMPLGHAFMIFMEHVLSSTALHYPAFTMGAVGHRILLVLPSKIQFSCSDRDYSSFPVKKKGGNWKSIVRLRGLQPGIQGLYTKEKAEPARHQDAGKQDGGKHDKISFDGNSSGAFVF